VKRATFCALIALAALSCTDHGAVGRLRPKPVSGPRAAGSAAAAAGQAAPACSQPPCAVLPCNPADWWCPLCATDQDCADDDERERLCNPITTFCVECRANDDCPASKPYCDDGDCGECAEDDDCPGDGKCNDAVCETD
jgi:hypothetical protein